MQEWDEWLRRRFRQYIWKQWKKPTTRITNLKKLGIPEEYACMWGNTRLGYWRAAGSAMLNRSITKEKLAKAGYYELASNYELKRLKHYGIWTAVYRTVRTVVWEVDCSNNDQSPTRLRVLFEKIQQIAIAFGFHLFVGDKAQGSTVDAVTYTVGWFAVTGENVA